MVTMLVLLHVPQWKEEPKNQNHTNQIQHYNVVNARALNFILISGYKCFWMLNIRNATALFLHKRVLIAGGNVTSWRQYKPKAELMCKLIYFISSFLSSSLFGIDNWRYNFYNLYINYNFVLEPKDKTSIRYLYWYKLLPNS